MAWASRNCVWAWVQKRAGCKLKIQKLKIDKPSSSSTITLVDARIWSNKDDNFPWKQRLPDSLKSTVIWGTCCLFWSPVHCLPPFRAVAQSACFRWVVMRVAKPVWINSSIDYPVSSRVENSHDTDDCQVILFRLMQWLWRPIFVCS